MKHVSILTLETAVIEAIADPHYLFKAVNQFLQAAGKTPLFQVELVGLSSAVQLENNLFTVHPEKQLTEVEATDLIVIPAISGEVACALDRNQAYLPWIIQQYHQGAELASLCLGAFVLAATGLLDGKKCSTHWNAANQFRKMFPEVELVDGSILTEEKRIYSSGGANSYWTLLLYLVEKYVDRDTAILAAKYFAVDIDRDSQADFVMFEGQKNHEDVEVLQAQLWIEANYQIKMTISELADRVALGRRSFERRFKQATNNTVMKYIQRVKIEAAKRRFERGQQTVREVMYEVGYADLKTFRTVFKQISGLSPIEYRNKYRKPLPQN